MTFTCFDFEPEPSYRATEQRRVIRLGDKLEVQIAKVDTFQEAGGFPARSRIETRRIRTTSSSPYARSTAETGSFGTACSERRENGSTAFSEKSTSPQAQLSNRPNKPSGR